MKQSANHEAFASASTANDLVVFQANSNRSIFVRDLPFACTSEVLRDYCAERLNVPIVKALVCENRKGRNLQFGCVLFETEDHVQLAIDVLNNTRFQGRDIRILRFDPAAPSETSSTGSIHVSFKTMVPKKQLTEEDLQEVFSQFGVVEHVSIRSLKFSDDGLQGGYGFLSFKSDAENQFAVEQCYQRVINDVIYDCQWSQRNPKNKQFDRKIRGERITVQKFLSDNNNVQTVNSSPIVESNENIASTRSNQRIIRNEIGRDASNKKGEFSDRKFGIVTNENMQYSVSSNTSTISNFSGNVFSTPIGSTQHYSSSVPGYIQSPALLNHNPNPSTAISQHSPIPSQYHPPDPQLTSSIPSIQLIPQFSPLPSPQQYYYASSPLDTQHSSSTYLIPSHQHPGQSNYQQSPYQSNALPSRYVVSLPATNQSMSVHNSSDTSLSHPLYSHVSPGDRNPVYQGFTYNSNLPPPPPPPQSSFVTPQQLTPSVNSDFPQQPSLMISSGVPVNMSIPTYYTNYYPMNTPIVYSSPLPPTLTTPNFPSSYQQTHAHQQNNSHPQRNSVEHHHINKKQQSHQS